MMQQLLEDCFPRVKKYWPVTLETLDQIGVRREHVSFRPGETLALDGIQVHTIPLIHPDGCSGFRSEERRVGKECRSRRASYQSKTREHRGKSRHEQGMMTKHSVV